MPASSKSSQKTRGGFFDSHSEAVLSDLLAIEEHETYCREEEKRTTRQKPGEKEGRIHFRNCLVRTPKGFRPLFGTVGCEAHAAAKAQDILDGPGASAEVLKNSCDRCTLRARPMAESEVARRLRLMPVDSLGPDLPFWLFEALAFLNRKRGMF